MTDARPKNGSTGVHHREVIRLRDESWKDWQRMGSKTMVLCAQLPSGYEIVVSASCVDPDAFDEEVAKEICRENLEDRIYEYLGAVAHEREPQHTTNGS